MMGLLNSRLFVFLYRLLALESGRVLAQVKPTILAQLPIRSIDFSNSTDKAHHDQIVNLVEERMALHKRLAVVSTPQEKTSLERQIAFNDTQIDGLVYDLYGLTADDASRTRHLIASFCDKIAELKPPLVTFNGNSFDLPVLRYRARAEPGGESSGGGSMRLIFVFGAVIA